MIKLVMFDLWGTIIENGVYSPVKQVKFNLRLLIPFSEYISRFEKAFMTQEFEDSKKGFENVCKEFNINYDEKLLNKLVGVWNKNWLLAREFPESRQVLEKMKNKFKLALVSNSDKSGERVVERFSLNDLFDKIYFSYKTGLLKTNKELFESVLSDFDVKPSEAVMIGDSIESDMKTPNELGIKTILIDRRNRRDYPVKAENLKEALMLIEKWNAEGV